MGGLETFFVLVMKRLGQLLTKFSTVSVPAGAADPEAAPQRADGGELRNRNLELAEVMVAVCFTAAIDIAILSLQIHSKLPISFFFVSLALLFGFSTFMMSMFLSSSKLTRAALVLERAGVFFVVTGFFFAVSIPFPLCLRVVTWVFYALCLLLVLLCNYFFGLWKFPPQKLGNMVMLSATLWELIYSMEKT